MVSNTTAPSRPLPDYYHSSMADPHLNNCGNPYMYRHQDQNPDIRQQQSSAFGIATGSLQQQPMVPTPLNMISQLTSLLNESYTSQNGTVPKCATENELHNKIKDLTTEIQYYKEECYRLRDENKDIRQSWERSKVSYEEMKEDIKEYKEESENQKNHILYIEKELEGSMSYCRDLKKDLEYYGEQCNHFSQEKKFYERNGVKAIATSGLKRIGLGDN